MLGTLHTLHTLHIEHEQPSTPSTTLQPTIPEVTVWPDPWSFVTESSRSVVIACHRILVTLGYAVVTLAIQREDSRHVRRPPPWSEHHPPPGGVCTFPKLRALGHT